ncbi:MAG TPA: ParA family protein [Verrucomicrobia bacterium]|nr:ParA family protein [Verrucomicrobiales bacterium]HIL55805.1 ParA family protein [Verrucomicrobiota bacterium]
MKIVAIANQKGGVGKTTTSINLSTCIASSSKESVLLIDLDPQGNTTSGLGLTPEPETSLYEVLLGTEKISSRIRETRFENLSIIPADMDLAGAEIELAQSENHLTRLREVLSKLKKSSDYDYVIIDCPPSLGVLMTSALAAADELLIPLQCEFFGLEGLAKIVHVQEQVRLSGANPNGSIEGIVMTMFDGRTNLSKQVVEQVRQYFPDEVYKTVIRRSIRLGEAPSYGQSIIEYDNNSNGAIDYRSLAKEFLKRHK